MPHHSLAPHSPSPSAPPRPDLADLVDRLGDPLVVEAVVDAYLDCLPERLDAIGAARHTPDEVSLRAAHSLRSASALLGLTALAETCGALEVALRTQPAAARPDLVEVVLRDAELAKAALVAHRDDLPLA